ncbi:MAG: CIA30 family protein [Comamonadaceae bacterium]|nr:CIA30 family protein [Comamonadaceae bacterium]
MGGVSRSRLRHDAGGHAVFEGTVSLERGGGFASVRCRPGTHGAPGAGFCVVAARGDGRRYKIGLLTDDRFDGIVYRAALAPEGEDWQRIRLPLIAFRPTRRGRELPGAPALEPAASGRSA